MEGLSGKVRQNWVLLRKIKTCYFGRKTKINQLQYLWVFLQEDKTSRCK